MICTQTKKEQGSRGETQKMHATWMPELHFECSSRWSVDGSGMNPRDPDERSEKTQTDSSFAIQKPNQLAAVSTCWQWTDKEILLHGDGAWTIQELPHAPVLCSHEAAETVGNSKFLLQMLRRQLPMLLHLARHRWCSALPRASTLQHREGIPQVLHPSSCLEQDYPQTLGQGGHGSICDCLSVTEVWIHAVSQGFRLKPSMNSPR